MTYFLLCELTSLDKALGESLLLAKNEWLALLLLSELSLLGSLLTKSMARDRNNINLIIPFEGLID